MPNFMTQFKTFLLSKSNGKCQLYYIFIYIFTEQNIPSALCYFTKRANSFCSLLICSNPQDFLSIKKISILIVKCIMLQYLCLTNTWNFYFLDQLWPTELSFKLEMHFKYMLYANMVAANNM